MKHFSKSASTLGLGLLLGALLAGCASGPSNPSALLSQRIEAARTVADHESLAKHYDNEAIASRAKAEKYRKLAKSATPSPTGGRGSSDSKARSNAIINVYESEAVEYEKLAAKQRAKICEISSSELCRQQPSGLKN